MTLELFIDRTGNKGHARTRHSNSDNDGNSGESSDQEFEEGEIRESSPQPSSPGTGKAKSFKHARSRYFPQDHSDGPNRSSQEASHQTVGL